MWDLIGLKTSFGGWMPKLHTRTVKQHEATFYLLSSTFLIGNRNSRFSYTTRSGSYSTL